MILPLGREGGRKTKDSRQHLTPGLVWSLLPIADASAAIANLRVRDPFTDHLSSQAALAHTQFTLDEQQLHFSRSSPGSQTANLFQFRLSTDQRILMK